MNLARLPVALFPGPVLDARVQPVSVHDLAAAVVALLGPALEQTGTIDCTGPEALTMGAFIASLRQQLGHRPATVLRLPQPLTTLSARLGDAVPQSPWCSETLPCWAATTWATRPSLSFWEKRRALQPAGGHGLAHIFRKCL